MKKTGKIKYCLKCKKEFYVPKHVELRGRGKYCSKKCCDLDKVGVSKINSGQFKKGYKHTEEEKYFISMVNLGRKTWNTGLKGYTNSGSFKSGAESLCWKGGITPLYTKIRRNFEYRQWRKLVKERDNFTCVWCGSTERPEADHIKPFSLFPKLRFDINNGRVLCHECHLTTKSFANKNLKMEDYINDSL